MSTNEFGCVAVIVEEGKMPRQVPFITIIYSPIVVFIGAEIHRFWRLLGPWMASIVVLLSIGLEISSGPSTKVCVSVFSYTYLLM